MFRHSMYEDTQSCWSSFQWKWCGLPGGGSLVSATLSSYFLSLNLFTDPLLRLSFFGVGLPVRSTGATTILRRDKDKGFSKSLTTFDSFYSR